MGNGIILRVLEGTELTPKLTASLDKLLTNYTIEYFKAKPDYQASLTRRIESLHNAFLFLLNAYPRASSVTPPLAADTLKDYVAHCKDECNSSKESFAESHEQLVQFTAYLVELISVGWKTDPEEAIEILNEAEQYVLMSQGRKDTATLTVTHVNDKEEVFLQLDESHSPCYPQLISEVNEIKARQFPKTPSALRQLKEYQKAYFLSLNETVNNPIRELKFFIKIWPNIKSDSTNLRAELEQINKNMPPLATWFTNLSQPLKVMMKMLSSHPDQIDDHLALFAKALVSLEPNLKTIQNHLIAIPEWYWVLPTRQQYFLEYVLKNANSAEDVMSFLPSRLRTLPAPANFGRHSLYHLNSAGTFELLGIKRYRSSHVASRDVLKMSEEVQTRHCDSNFAKVTEHASQGQPILMQTLISPIHLIDLLPDTVKVMLPEKTPPDLQLYNMARKTINQGPRAKQTVQHNHPYNVAKYLYYTQKENSDSEQLIKLAEHYKAMHPELTQLVIDYKLTLASAAGTATFLDYDGRELFLSSLEQLIIFQFGFSYGSCVSGKDRKAIELIHTDAMLLYKQMYGFWPKYGDPKDKNERQAFVNLVAQLYLSRHQHELAGQNAPGSDGIKNPTVYFPSDIADTITTRLGIAKCLKYDDRLATDNEVKNINHHLVERFSKKWELLSKLIAKQIGEEHCTRLYTALTALINETQRFIHKEDEWSFFGSKDTTPTGITNLRQIMAKAGGTNVERLASMFVCVLEREKENPKRTSATKSVYGRMVDFVKPRNSTDLSPLVEATITEWQNLFNESKDVNSSLAQASCF